MLLKVVVMFNHFYLPLLSSYCFNLTLRLWGILNTAVLTSKTEVRIYRYYVCILTPLYSSHIATCISINTKWINIAKGITNFVTNNACLTKKVIRRQQQNKISIIKILARAGNRIRDLVHRSRMCYLCTTKSTESIDCCQVRFLWHLLFSIK